MTRSIAIACVLVLAAPLGAYAQSSAIKRAAESITEADVRRRIFLIADDSMGGRYTPSPGLSKTADYIASEFRRFGLKPGGDTGTYMLSFPIATRRILADRSTVRFSGDRSIETTLAGGATFLRGPTSVTAKGGVVLVGGAVVADSLKAEDLKGRIAVYVPPANTTRMTATVFQRLLTAGVSALVLVMGSDSVFAEMAGQRNTQTTVGDGNGGPPVILVRESLIVSQVPDAADQFAQLRAAPVTVVQVVPEWSGEIAIRDTTLALSYAPNVVGILEGSDAVLKNEYVVFSAHMDHIGTLRTPARMPDSLRARADTINNGADDDGSGTVGVVELAEAFSRPGARPRRSLIFLTVSGEEEGLWGSDWFVGHPPVPLPQIVADINADMIGRNWKDTIVAIGKEHSDLGSTLNRVNAAHPELNMVAIDDRWPEERFYFRSDHYNFARKGVPILFFFNGVHADYHQPTDSPDKIDAEKEARILKLLFYVGLEVANSPSRPQWVPESYKQIVVP